MFRFHDRKYELWLVFIFLTALCLQPLSNAEQTQDAPLGSKYSGLHDSYGPPSSSMKVPAASPFRESAERLFTAPGKYQETVDAKLAEALIKAAEKAGTLAKTVGTSIGDYVKEKQVEKKQEELVQRFYDSLYSLVRPLSLSPEEFRELITRVENLYIEDGETGKLKLDAVYFRELPMIVKREYADMALERTRNGTVDTYYLSGALKTRWQIQNGQPQGAAITYYENGEMLYIDTYEKGQRIYRKKYDKEGRLEFEQAYQYDMPAVSQPESPASEAPRQPAPQVPAPQPPAVQPQAVSEAPVV